MSRFISSWQSDMARLNRWLIIGSGALLLFAMFYSVFGVVSFFIFHKGFPGIIEITENILVVTVFLSITYYEITSGHVRMDLVTSRLRPRARAICDIIVSAISTVVLGLLARQNILYTAYLISNDVRAMGLVRIPLFIPVGFIVLGCSLFSLYSLSVFLGKIMALIHPGSSSAVTNHVTGSIPAPRN